MQLLFSLKPMETAIQRAVLNLISAFPLPKGKRTNTLTTYFAEVDFKTHHQGKSALASHLQKVNLRYRLNDLPESKSIIHAENHRIQVY